MIIFDDARRNYQRYDVECLCQMMSDNGNDCTVLSQDAETMRCICNVTKGENATSSSGVAKVHVGVLLPWRKSDFCDNAIHRTNSVPKRNLFVQHCVFSALRGEI